jgi:ribonuclease BN (tRNA processing enzyme)
LALRLWILGSGTLIPHPQRGAPAHLIEAGSSSILMDCGSGTLQTLARLDLPWHGITHLLISHFHTDHVGDLASLMFAFRHGLPRPREEPLYLLGPPGLHGHLEALSKAHGAHVVEPGFPLMAKELSPGSTWADPGGEIRIKASGTTHTENSIAFRVETDAGALGYSGDTGPSRELGSFFKGCQVVVAECSHPDGAGTDSHLTPETLADLARLALPRILVSVHVYPPLDPDVVPELLARAGYGGTVLAGRDGLCVEWVGGRVIARSPLEEV